MPDLPSARQGTSSRGSDLRIVTILLAAILPGCAISSTSSSGPGGKPVHTVTATGADAAYRKAQQVCPSGYRVVGTVRATALEYSMSVQCN